MKTIHFPFLLASTATTTSYIETVADNFARLAKGDVPAILAKLADNVDWHHNGDPSLIPFAKPYFGKAGVAEFFQTLVQSLALKNVVPSNFRQVGNEVHHDFHVEAEVLSTGKSYAVDAQYIWGFDQHGKICSYRCTGDMSPAEEAFRS